MLNTRALAGSRGCSPAIRSDGAARPRQGESRSPVEDESLEDSAKLPPPEIIAAEIAKDLRAALEQPEAI